MPYYAEIDNENKCIAISELKPTINSNLIPIDSYAIELIGSYYDNIEKTWNNNTTNSLANISNNNSLEQIKKEIYLPPVEEIEIGPTQSDKIELEIENLKTQQNEILEKLNMLLNIQGDV